VRRQDVKVDERGSETTGVAGASRAAFESFDSDFRSDFKGRRIDGGYTYDQYAPVYRYGYMLANDQRYAGQGWSAIEPEARTRWEERNPGTWDQFKDSVREAWDRVRGRAWRSPAPFSCDAPGEKPGRCYWRGS
jgi:hypothetical protein